MEKMMSLIKVVKVTHLSFSEVDRLYLLLTFHRALLHFRVIVCVCVGGYFCKAYRASGIQEHVCTRHVCVVNAVYEVAEPGSKRTS